MLFPAMVGMLHMVTHL